MEFTAKQIAEFLGGTIDGNENATVHTFAKIEEGIPGALSFLSNSKYTHYLYSTKSSVVLVNKDFKPDQPVTVTLVRVDNAYESLAKLMSLYTSMKPGKSGISSLASVSDKAKIGQNVYIGPFSVIEDDAVIGDDTQIYPHVTVVYSCRIESGEGMLYCADLSIAFEEHCAALSFPHILGESLNHRLAVQVNPLYLISVVGRCRFESHFQFKTCMKAFAT